MVVFEKPEVWDKVQMNEYKIQMPGVKNAYLIQADSVVHDKEFGFTFLYVEGSLVAKVPREALIIKTGKLHK